VNATLLFFAFFHLERELFLHFFSPGKRTFSSLFFIGKENFFFTFFHRERELFLRFFQLEKRKNLHKEEAFLNFVKLNKIQLA